MKDGEPTVVRRDAYRPPSHWVDAVELRVELAERDTIVRSRLQVRAAASAGSDLRLDGVDLELREVAIDGRVLTTNEYAVDEFGLTLFDLPAECVVECVTRIDPDANTALEGLYRSHGMYCTQCEAEGFRKITYMLDRPDVMARYRTTVVADAERYPVLLANGNPIARQTLADGRHEVTWEDPFPKPTYLFALVAGDLVLKEAEFVTCCGRRVRLCIYSEPHNIAQCDYALDVLQRAMRWDEQRFGREYDLDIFMVVAVEHFNMGAMENKGLNIFNTNCVLARADTTTDAGFQRVESVVAHEYFHNWSGNRVTCRDWFQLSLKEGFTVYRDQEFSADIGSRAVTRIEDVVRLRTAQFPEDAGPMAHSIRPESYLEINNFYTPTVYEKGAEIVRMLATLLGWQAFRAGCDLYFARHDGQAATCDDFVQALQDASGVNLVQFRRWYASVGTPVLTATSHYDAANKRLTLSIRQEGSACEPPLHIPLLMGLLANDGSSQSPNAVQAQVGAEVRDDGWLLHFTESEQQFVFEGVASAPVLSLLRGFSAPVRLRYARADGELALLARRDSDGFARWDAVQRYFLDVLDAHRRTARIDDGVVDLIAGLLARASDEDPALLTMLATPPSLSLLCDEYDPMPIDELVAAHDALLDRLANTLRANWLALYEQLAPREAYAPTPAQMGRRALRSLALTMLARRDDGAVRELLAGHYDRADNMTDRLCALRAILDHRFDVIAPLRARCVEDFLARFRHEALVVDLWLSAEAQSPRPGGAARIAALAAHPLFDVAVPNKVSALYSTFATRNPAQFHARDGSGYRIIGETVAALQASNPQVAARLAKSLSGWRRTAGPRAQAMREQLASLAALPALSPDLYEVVEKSLAAG